jgi:hypothetical protein
MCETRGVHEEELESGESEESGGVRRRVCGKREGRRREERKTTLRG